MGTVLNSSLLNLAATGVSVIAGFAVSMLTARLLGPEGAGLTAFSLWFAMSLSALIDRGIPQMLLRALAEGDDAQQALWKVRVVTGLRRFLPGILLGVFGIAVWASYQSWHEGGADALQWASTALLFALYALFAFATAVSRGLGNFREAALSTVSGSLLQLPFIVIGAIFLGPAGAIAGMAVRFLPQVLKLASYVDRAARPDPASLSPDMRIYARQMWLSDLIDVILMTRVELALLGIFLSASGMGYFAVAAVFAGLVGQFAFQISPALVVGFSSARGHAEKQASLFRDAMRFTALAVFPVAFGGAAIAPGFIAWVFGAEFAPAAKAASLLLVSSAFTGIAVVPWAYLAARGNSGKLLSTMIVLAIVTIGLLSGAIAVAGLEGAAVARIAIELLSFCLLAVVLRRANGPAIPFGALFRTALAAASCGLAAFAITAALPGTGGMFAAVVGGALTYAAALRVFRLIAPQDGAMLLDNAAFNRLPRLLRSSAKLLISIVTPRV